MNIDDYIARRNAIQLKAEAKGDVEGAAQWTKLGVANRHITRVLEGILTLDQVREEIERCLAENEI